MKKRIISLLLAVVMLLGVVSVGVSAETETTQATENTETTESTEASTEAATEPSTEPATEPVTEPSTEPTEPSTEPPVPEEPDTGFHASDACIAILKAEEGFSRVPYWDYAQYTVGYGTRCPDDKLEEYTKNGITEEEAEILLRNALNGFEESINKKLIERHGLTVTQNQFDAMLLFSYNCGTSWLTSSTNDNLRKAIIAGATGNELIDRFTRWCNAGGQIRTYLLRRRLSEANMYLNGVYSQRPPENYAYVLYDANGGVSNPNVQGFDTNLTSQIIPTPTYEGHTFKGWYTAANGGTLVTVLDGSVKNSRLYAHWEANAGSNPQPPAQEPQTGVVITITAANLNVRTGAGTNYRICGSVRKGEQYTITETANGSGYLWGKYSGGWICLEYTNYDSVTAEKPSQPEKPPVVMGTVKVSSYLCVRSGPSTGYSIVAKLSNGTRVEISEQKVVGAMVWGKIPSGWVSMDYIELDATEPPATEPPVTEPPVTEPPVTEPPVTEPPVTEPPVTEPPVTEPPVTEPPVTEPPVTEPPVTEPPVTEPAPTVRTGKVKVNSVLRVRSGPGTSYGVAGYLYNNNQVTITEQTTVGSTTWGKTDKGWISMEYVVLDQTSSGSQSAPVQKETGTVTAKQPLRIRSGAGTSYSIVGYLKSNARVEILEQKTVNGMVWGRVSKGWISMDYIALDGGQPPVAEKPQSTVKTVTASCLRVRGSAGTNSNIVGYLYSGSKVEILETQTVNGTVWGRISKGWISMDYVK